jgi:hypothetical protein
VGESVVWGVSELGWIIGRSSGRRGRHWREECSQGYLDGSYPMTNGICFPRLSPNAVPTATDAAGAGRDDPDRCMTSSALLTHNDDPERILGTSQAQLPGHPRSLCSRQGQPTPGLRALQRSRTRRYHRHRHSHEDTPRTPCRLGHRGKPAGSLIPSRVYCACRGTSQSLRRTGSEIPSRGAAQPITERMPLSSSCLETTASQPPLRAQSLYLQRPERSRQIICLAMRAAGPLL